jgi:hypothetical protein
MPDCTNRCALATTTILITVPNGAFRPLKVKVRNYVVSNSEEDKFLGLPLHAALKWKQWVAAAARRTSGAIGILSWLRHTWWGAEPLLLLRLYKSLVRARIEYGDFLIHVLSNSQKTLPEKIQLKVLKSALGLRSSTPANIVSPLEIRFRYLARNFVTRMITNEDHPLRTTLEEVIDWKENPVNTDRVGTVPLIEAFRDIVPKEHLIGKASLPLCCKTTFTSVMSRQSVGIDRGTKLAVSPEPLRDLFRGGAEANQEPFHR